MRIRKKLLSLTANMIWYLRKRKIMQLEILNDNFISIQHAATDTSFRNFL